MKKNLFYCLLAVLCTVTLFTSCKDDDGPGNEGDIKKVMMENVLGTYSGELKVSLEGGINLQPVTQKIFVEQDGADKVKLSLRNFSISVGGAPVSVGNIEVNGIALEGDANNVVLQETSTTMQHAKLGKLDITVSGNVVNGKANLRIDVVQVALPLNILVTFEGNRISTEVDVTDYAKEVEGWYAQESITAMGQPDGFEITSPGNNGIEFTYAGYNEINIKNFPLSFPPNVQYISLKNVKVEKAADGSIAIVEVKQNVKDTQSGVGEIAVVLSGVIKDSKPTLNISLKSADYAINYVFTGKEKKLTGYSIESVTIKGDLVKVQPEIGTEMNTMDELPVVFFLKEVATAEQIKNLIPVFEVSDGATLKVNGKNYVADTPLDFTTAQKITVVSQKGDAEQVYNVECKIWWDNVATNLNTWTVQNPNDDENLQYSEPVNGWSSSNGGVYYIKALFQLPVDYAVTETSDAKSGKAACLKTLDTQGMSMGFTSIPKVTSGSLFNGSFVVNLTNTLMSTQFGDPCDKEPKSFSGSYKYTPGKTYYRATTPGDPTKAHQAVPDDTMKDTPALNAILYEVDSYAFDYLDGTNLFTSDKVVSVAAVEYNEASNGGYLEFNAPFEYKNNKTFDPVKKYKLAIVCSSSKDGDKFSGAPGSELLVDDLKVNF